MITFIQGAVFVVSLTLNASAPACAGLEITDGWVREAPPGASVMAAYARLHNAAKHAVTVSAVDSPAFGSVEMHRTEMQGGQMKMRSQPDLRVGPGATVALEPGGLHLMLFDPRRTPKAGDRIEFGFSCGGARRAAEFTVRSGD